MTQKTLISQPPLVLLMRLALCLALGCLLLPCLIHGQALQSEPSELDAAVKKAKSGNVDARDVVVIANARAVQAMPLLEQQFRRTTDVNIKVSIASGLVKLRDGDDAYWKFLSEQVAHAIDSDIPDSAYSESRKEIVKVVPELQVWADAHGVSLNAAWQYSRFDIPGKVLQLASTGDPRGIPLLQRAMQSRNYLVVSSAAKGLAEIQDKASIPLIIAAAQRAPYGYSSLVAESLVYFDDFDAQAAVDKYVPSDRAKFYRDAKARGMKPFGY